jgi:hypothetical protein
VTLALRRPPAIPAVLAGALATVEMPGPRILDPSDPGGLLHGTPGPDPVAWLLA